MDVDFTELQFDLPLYTQCVCCDGKVTSQSLAKGLELYRDPKELVTRGNQQVL